jgi:hypothetical protein
LAEPLLGGGPIPPFAQHASGAPRSKGLGALEDFCGWFEWKVEESDWEDLDWCEYLARRLKKMRWALYAVHDPASWERLKKLPSVSKLLKQLFRLAGTTTVFGPDPLEMRFKQHRLLREDSTILLSCMGQFAPAAFRPILLKRVSSVLMDPVRLGNRAVAAVDAAGRQLTFVVDPELEGAIWGVLSQVRTWQSPRLHLRAMAAWARIAWRREDFVGDFASSNPEGPWLLFSTVERQLEHLTLQVVKERSIADARRGYFLFPFQTYCEVLLALMRLRGTDNGAGLDAGSPRLNALARTVRRLDGMLTLRGCPLDHSRLKLRVNKPAHLYRVSDLAWLLSSMLTGTEELGHVHIEASDDD